MAVTKKQATEQMPKNRVRYIELLESYIDSKLILGIRHFTDRELQQVSDSELQCYELIEILKPVYIDWKLYSAGGGEPSGSCPFEIVFK